MVIHDIVVMIWPNRLGPIQLHKHMNAFGNFGNLFLFCALGLFLWEPIFGLFWWLCVSKSKIKKTKNKDQKSIKSFYLNKE